MGAYWGPQQWWKILHPSIVTNGLVLNLDAGNPASYTPNGGGDSYLLLHADGANDSTNFIDSGTYAHTITPTGNAKISTVKSKFGGSSFRADNTSPFILSQLKFPTVTLSGDFTLALWVNFDNISGDQAVLGAESGNNQLFRFNGDNVSGGLMSYSDDFIFGPTANEISFMQSNQWYYLTMTRSGSIVKTFIDGQLLQTNNNFASTITLNTIGAGYLGYQTPFTGYIDDVVILDGTCLYTESFTAPVSPYNSGTTWYDLSGNGNDGTLVNGVSYDSANGGSLVFDGVNDYGTVPYNSTFDLSGDYALEGWFKASSFNNESLLISKDTYGENYDWGINITNNTTIKIYTAGTVSSITATVPQLQPNTWYNIIITGISGTTKIYVNAVEYGSGSFSLTNSSQSFITLGCAGWNNPFGFTNGNISVLRVYQNKGLTQQEVTQNYNVLKDRYI